MRKIILRFTKQARFEKKNYKNNNADINQTCFGLDKIISIHEITLHACIYMI